MYNESAYVLGAIFGAIIVGAIIGAIPAIAGAVKGKIGLAVGGFFACLGAHFLLGLILSVPACAVFMFLIFKKDAKTWDNERKTIDTNDIKFCPKCGAQLLTEDCFCPKCGNSQQ